MSSGTEPPAGGQPGAEAGVPAGGPAGGRPRGARLPGITPGRRPSTTLIVVTAVIVAIIAAVIAIDATTHRAPGPAAALKPAPGFALPSLLDPAQQVSLSAYRGHPVIVNFFASWCGPCQRETPLLARFYRASHGQVRIIGVDADDQAAAARSFVAAKGVGYPIGFETTPAVADAYNVSEIGIPETFFLNARHLIVKRVLGGVTMQDLTAGVALMDGGTAR